MRALVDVNPVTVVAVTSTGAGGGEAKTDPLVVTPKSVGSFGSLYEVACGSNEIFINGAEISDIEIIDAVTASQLKATSAIVTTSGT